MGIPLYFKQIADKYPNIIKDNIENKYSLFLDLNCAIHPCCGRILEEYNTQLTSKSTLENKMITEILIYIEKLVKMVNPKLLYIAIDGVAPLSKMNQQRLRRYKSVYEKEQVNNIKKKLGIEAKPNVWDTNAISPGTEFMDKLSHRIKYELAHNQLYNSIKIYFSDQYNPGEGEHKILNFIKQTKLDNIVIYGLDADLIMLSFVSNKSNIYLLRESLAFGKPVMDKFLYLDIDQLRYYIVKEIQEKIISEDNTIVFTNIKLFNIIL